MSPDSQAAMLTVTPLVPAGDSLADALRFYTEQLGFAITWEGGEMAGVRRGRVDLNLVQNRTRAWADNASATIGVDDLEALFGEQRRRSARLR